MKSSAITKWISTLSLFVIVLSVLISYIIMRSVESCHEYEGFIYVQLLFMVIIGTSFVAFFISWKLNLSLTGIEARMKDEIDHKILESQKEQIIEVIDYDAEVEKIISKICHVDSIDQFAENTLSSCCHSLEFVTGIFFKLFRNEYSNIATWAFVSSQMPENFKLGEGLSGQVAKNQQAIFINDLPENYINIYSGTGNGKPKSLYIIPLIKGSECVALLEFASFKNGSENTLTILKLLSEKLVNNFTQLNN